MKPLVKAMKDENRAAQRADSVDEKANGVNGKTCSTAQVNDGTANTNGSTSGTQVETNGNTGTEDDGATNSDAMDVDAKPSVDGEAESKPLDKGKQRAVAEPSDDGDPDEIIRISIADDLLCEHGKLHPSNSTAMKRIRRDVYDKIAAHTKCVFEPLVTPQDVCRECVEVIFKGEEIGHCDRGMQTNLIDQIAYTRWSTHALSANSMISQRYRRVSLATGYRRLG